MFTVNRCIENVFFVLCERAFFLLDNNNHLGDIDKLELFQKVSEIRDGLEQIQTLYNEFENNFGI